MGEIYIYRFLSLVQMLLIMSSKGFAQIFV